MGEILDGKAKLLCALWNEYSRLILTLSVDRIPVHRGV